MRQTLLLLALLATLTGWAQSTGSISGTVKTSDGSPAEYVNVGIEGTSRGTSADRNGNFEIKNLKPGTYTLLVSFIGLEGQRRSVEVIAGEVRSEERRVGNECVIR